MSPAAFRKLALSFPEAHEEPHFDRASFRVGKKIFATLAKDGTAMVRVAPPSELMLLLEGQPEVFFSFGGWTTKNGSLGVHLAAVDPALMRELLEGSWAHVAPAKKEAKKKATSSSGPKKKRASKRR
jgi:hypothetical protein